MPISAGILSPQKRDDVYPSYEEVVYYRCNQRIVMGKQMDKSWASHNLQFKDDLFNEFTGSNASKSNNYLQQLPAIGCVALKQLLKDETIAKLTDNNSNINSSSSSRETHSFLYKKEMIIGREKEKQILKDVLLDTSVSDTEIVSIVGVGGLGKTVLAKLLFNDPDIQAEFSPKMWWVYVSNDFDVKSLLAKILAEATNTTPDSGLSMNQLHKRLQQLLYQTTKYLLVLDDVRNNEDDVWKWDDLKSILMQGGRGSRIIVTTRSITVANLAGTHLIHGN